MVSIQEAGLQFREQKHKNRPEADRGENTVVVKGHSMVSNEKATSPSPPAHLSQQVLKTSRMPEPCENSVQID